MQWGNKMDNKNTEKIANDIFSLADNLASDIIGSNTKRSSFQSKQSAFADLIHAHNNQMSIVSKTYEHALVVLSEKIVKLNSVLDEAEDIIGKLEADKENLEDDKENLQELLGKYQEKETKKEEPKEEIKKKDAGKKSKPKIPK